MQGQSEQLARGDCGLWMAVGRRSKAKGLRKFLSMSLIASPTIRSTPIVRVLGPPGSPLKNTLILFGSELAPRPGRTCWVSSVHPITSLASVAAACPKHAWSAPGAHACQSYMVCLLCGGGIAGYIATKMLSTPNNRCGKAPCLLCACCLLRSLSSVFQGKQPAVGPGLRRPRCHCSERKLCQGSRAKTRTTGTSTRAGAVVLPDRKTQAFDAQSAPHPWHAKTSPRWAHQSHGCAPRVWCSGLESPTPPIRFLRPGWLLYITPYNSS